MRHVGPILCLVALVYGCSEGSPVSPSVQALPVGSTASPRVTYVGEEVSITGGHDGYTFMLAAPSNGTLTVRLTWNEGAGPLQMFVWETTASYIQFGGDGSPLPPVVSGKRSLVGSLPVTRDTVYRIRVADVTGDVFCCSLVTPFTMSTSLVTQS